MKIIVNMVYAEILFLKKNYSYCQEPVVQSQVNQIKRKCTPPIAKVLKHKFFFLHPSVCNYARKKLHKMAELIKNSWFIAYFVHLFPIHEKYKMIIHEMVML